jgi:hypothetical protein
MTHNNTIEEHQTEAKLDNYNDIWSAMAYLNIED